MLGEEGEGVEMIRGFWVEVLAKTPSLYQVPKLKNLKSGKKLTDGPIEGLILAAGRG